MPNTIALAKNYTSLLDLVYKQASVTETLVSPAEVIRAGSQANTIVYPQISVNGLGDYSRSSGYTDNAVTVAWKEAAFNYDRGTKISVDVMDNEESRNIAFARAGGELIRTKVAPEADAWTFAELAGTSGISSESGALSAGADLLSALYAATVQMDEDEVPSEGRVLFITPTLIKLVNMLDTTKSREILGYFSQIVQVPQSRFYTAIDLLDGKPASGSGADAHADETMGGYKAHVGGYKLNFMVVDPSALIKFDKHVVSDIIPAALNADADADILKYRKYGIVKVFDNKKAGIYMHRDTTAIAV